MYSSAYVWAKVLSYVEEKLSAVTVSAWFDDAEVVELTEDKLIIYRYHELSDEFRNLICKEAADEIRNSNLINTPGPMADYYRKHYPESWAKVKNQ